MNIEYLKSKYLRAKSLDADIVKIDIEEFESLLEWIIDENHRRIVDSIEYGRKLGNADAIEKFVSNFEKEFAPNLDESLTTMIEFNKWFEKVNKIAEQLKEQLKEQERAKRGRE